MRGSWVTLFLLGIAPLTTCRSSYHYRREPRILLDRLGWFRGKFEQECSANDDCVSLCHDHNCIWLSKEEAEYSGKYIERFMFRLQERHYYSRYRDADDPRDGKLSSYAPGVCKSGTCHRSCSPRCPDFEFCALSDGLCKPPQPDGATCIKGNECEAFCVDGVCKGRELGGSCEHSKQCDSRFCLGGVCRPDDLEEGDECYTHWVCASNACHNNRCVPGDLGDYEQCHIPEQCASRYCLGECRPMDVEDGGRCHAGMQCKSRLCLQGTCGKKGVSDSGSCRDDAECASYKCIHGKCANKRLNYNDRCNKDSECETGYCKNNKCAVSIGQSCKTEGDCPGRGPTYCSSAGKCGHTHFYGDKCSATEQCLKGHCCVRGKCDSCPGMENASCERHSDCGSGLYCYKSIVFPERKQCYPADGSLNSPCGAKNKCRAALECRAGSCKSPGWTNKDGGPWGYLLRPFTWGFCSGICSANYESKDCQACIAQGEVSRY
ncbi:hypothetical protein NYO67_3285 [Aspergillus flavus]|nr:hypothetical protein NYO67_3285 [Aspergillus flavus]